MGLGQWAPEAPNLMVALWSTLKPPRIIFRSPPLNPTSEPSLRWWHIAVANVRRNWQMVSKPAQNCYVYFHIEDKHSPHTFDRQGMWSTPNGPVERVSLIVDDPDINIPVVLRRPLWTGTASPDIPTSTFETMLTDLQFLAHGETGNIIRLEPGEYHVAITIRAGHKIYRKETFELTVPDKGLEGFRLASPIRAK